MLCIAVPIRAKAMGRSAFIAVLLLLLLEIAAQAGTTKASTLVKPREDIWQSEFEVTKEAKDTQDWDDEFEGTPTLRVLTDDNFEHDTQAATGQTTGIWLVLFWSRRCVTCRDAEATLQQVYTQMKDGHLIIAGVDVSSSPRTVKRFDVQKVPLLILFRDQRMYTYKGHWAAMNIIKFVKDGYEKFPAEEVPKEITYFDQLWEMPSIYYHAVIKYMANRPGILAGVGSTLAMCGYLYTRRCLLKKHVQKKGSGRPRKRVD